MCGGEVHVLGWTELVHDVRRRQLPKHGGHGGDELYGLPRKYCIDGRSDELLLQHGLLCERGDAREWRVVHTVTCRVVLGDDERRVDVLYDERRHRDELSGGDAVCGGDVHLLGWAELVHHVRRRQLLEHGGHGGDELHGLSDEQCSVCRRDELLLQHGLLRECSDAL